MNEIHALRGCLHAPTIKLAKLNDKSNQAEIFHKTASNNQETLILNKIQWELQ